jgi:hypothetical protein
VEKNNGEGCTRGGGPGYEFNVECTGKWADGQGRYGRGRGRQEEEKRHSLRQTNRRTILTSMGEDGDRLVRFADYGENVSNVDRPQVKCQVNDKRCMEKRERRMDEKKMGR